MASLKWMIAAIAACASACGGATTKAAGTEQGPCYGNETCNAGLACLSSVCVNPNSNDAGSSGGSVNVGSGGAVAAGGGGRSGASSGGATTSGGTGGGSNATSGGTGGGSSAASGGTEASSGGFAATGGSGDGGASSGGVAATGGTGAAPGVSDAGPYPPLKSGDVGKVVQISIPSSVTRLFGTLWDPCGSRLLFSDAPASVIYELDSDNQTRVFMSNTGQTSGLAFDADGNLLLAETGAPGVGGVIERRDAMGNLSPVSTSGTTLGNPYDLTAIPLGAFFSDSGYTMQSTAGQVAFVLDAHGQGFNFLSTAAASALPNGVETALDGQSFYFTASDGSVRTVSIVAPPAGPPRLAQGDAMVTGLNKPDGLSLDQSGNFYIAVSTGIQILGPDGRAIQSVPVPSGATDCAFGGADGKTLYITSTTTLWKIESMPIPGQEWAVDRMRTGCSS